MNKSYLRLLPFAFGYLFFLFCIISAYDTVTGFTGFIRFGEVHFQNAIPEIKEATVYVYENSDGYDGQFYAQLAVEPSVTSDSIRSAMDDPGYRARRILLSAASYLFGFGNDKLIIFTYSIINVVFWLLLSILLLKWLPDRSLKSFFKWFGCLFSLGCVSSVVLALIDLPAAFLSLLALYCFDKNRIGASRIAFASAVLTKETYLLSVFSTFKFGECRKFLLTCFLAVIPLLLWMIYLRAVGLTGSPGSSGNFAFPFAGLIYEIRTTFVYLTEGKTHNILALITLIYQVVYLLWKYDFNSALWKYGLPFICLMIVLGPVVWEGDPGAAYRVLIPATFAFNLLLKTDKFFYAHWILGNLSLVIGVKYLLKLM